jgi:Anti-sigma factor NepR
VNAGQMGKAELPAPVSANSKQRDPDAVGHALRTVYQQAIEEPVPPEILDLLARLR